MTTIDPRRGESPLANFDQHRQGWVSSGVCTGLIVYIPPLMIPMPVAPVFFPDDARGAGAPAYDAARSLCASCTVRSQCAQDALDEEKGQKADDRHGMRGYLTPAQRHTIERQGGLRGRDPMKIVKGRKGRRPVPPLPDGGDVWTRHHTTLARKVLAWLPENVKVGQPLPTQTKLCEVLHCNPSPLRRVMEALVQDGTLAQVQPKPGARGANGATVKYVRKRAVRRVASWTPTHIPAQIDRGVPSD